MVAQHFPPVSMLAYKALPSLLDSLGELRPPFAMFPLAHMQSTFCGPLITLVPSDVSSVMCGVVQVVLTRVTGKVK